MNPILSAIKRFHDMERFEREFIGPPCPPLVLVPEGVASIPEAAAWLERERASGRLLPFVGGLKHVEPLWHWLKGCKA